MVGGKLDCAHASGGRTLQQPFCDAAGRKTKAVQVHLQVNELQKLDLSHNELQQLPEQMGSLTALHTLHVR